MAASSRSPASTWTMRRQLQRQPRLVPHSLMIALVWARALEAEPAWARAKEVPPRLAAWTHCMRSRAPTRSPRMGA
eukprot:7588401-Prorocentrum_lima.AAC.2